LNKNRRAEGGDTDGSEAGELAVILSETDGAVAGR